MNVTLDRDTIDAINRVATALENIAKILEAPSAAAQQQIDELATKVQASITKLEGIQK